MKLVDGVKLVIYSGGGGFLQGAGEKVECVYGPIGVSGGWLR